MSGAMILSMMTTLNLSVFAADAENVNLVNNGDMESGTDWWYKNGCSTLEPVKDEKHGGESSIKASGRTDSWQGVAQNLVDSKAAKPVAGNKYHAPAWVMFKGTRRLNS
jgi:endo-1,4-beta-xylanase